MESTVPAQGGVGRVAGLVHDVIVRARDDLAHHRGGEPLLDLIGLSVG